MRFFNNLINKLRAFMYGRYGADGLYYGLWVAFILFWLAGLFASNALWAMFFYLLQLASIAYMFFRFFSKNIYARRRENEAFMKFFRSFKNFFILQKNKIRDIKSYRYRKCPKCKASLRLPNKKGTHTVRCPRCSQRFEVKINL